MDHCLCVLWIIVESINYPCDFQLCINVAHCNKPRQIANATFSIHANPFMFSMWDFPKTLNFIPNYVFYTKSKKCRLQIDVTEWQSARSLPDNTAETPDSSAERVTGCESHPLHRYAYKTHPYQHTSRCSNPAIHANEMEPSSLTALSQPSAGVQGLPRGPAAQFEELE